MDAFSLENPVFRTYVIAASIAILKMLGHAYLVVYNMLSVSGGFLNPEDRRKTVGNPNPSPNQTDPNERVERARRMHRNEGENTPLFLIAGLLFVAAAPAPELAPWLLYGYVVARFLHFAAYATAQDHEVRATFYTIGTLFIAALTGFALYAAVTH
jgi:glutathione S-transferase